MILFRCWFCGKKYGVVDTRVGERMTCSCKHLLKVPKENNGRCKVLRPVDLLIESVLYGGGGALLGLGLGLLIVSRIPIFRLGGGGKTIAVLTIIGFVAGTFGGERGVNWVGRMIRSREDA
ncbi:MAG TPA: hypothetical protein VHR66_02385 [Gemmataceae bacterium]|jgi:hypothetical protein|nr:hypothetical protein [Gemmataceae bacterium]